MAPGALDFVHDNAPINMETSELVHDPALVADRGVRGHQPALEIDLTGQ
jgi:hypothetical protein